MDVLSHYKDLRPVFFYLHKTNDNCEKYVFVEDIFYLNDPKEPMYQIIRSNVLTILINIIEKNKDENDTNVIDIYNIINNIINFGYVDKNIKKYNIKKTDIVNITEFDLSKGIFDQDLKNYILKNDTMKIEFSIMDYSKIKNNDLKYKYCLYGPTFYIL